MNGYPPTPGTRPRLGRVAAVAAAGVRRSGLRRAILALVLGALAVPLPGACAPSPDPVPSASAATARPADSTPSPPTTLPVATSSATAPAVSGQPPAVPSRPVIATVQNDTTSFLSLDAGGALVTLPAATFSTRGVTTLAGGAILATDDSGDMRRASLEQAAAGTWERLGARLGETGDPSALTPQDDRQGGLIAVRVDSATTATFFHLDLTGRTLHTISVPVALDGPIEPLDDGQVLVIRRAAGDRPLITLLAPDGTLRNTVTQAYAVAVGGEIAVIQDRVASLAVLARDEATRDELLNGPSASVDLPGVSRATPDRFALDASGSRLLVVWRDDADRLRLVTLLERGADRGWAPRAAINLPDGTERAFVAWTH
jgi:hypothetical protein